MLSVIVGIVLGIALPQPPEEIVIQFRRPSRLLAMLSGKAASSTSKEQVKSAAGGEGLLPDGVKVKADDRKSVLVVTGEREAIDNLKRFIELFDVGISRMSVEMTLSCVADKYETRYQAVIDNQETWTTHDSALQMGLALTCRMNSDGTATVTATLPGGPIVKAIVVRVPPQNKALMILRRGATIAYNIADPREGLPVGGWTIVTADKPILDQRFDFDPEGIYASIKLAAQPSRVSQIQGRSVVSPPPAG
jgi:hypothetical protein